MNHQMLELAPITTTALDALRDEIHEVLGLGLSARRLVDVIGPLGRDTAALSTGRRGPTLDLGNGGTGRIRHTQPLLEVSVPFSIARTTLDDLDRGVADADVDNARDAARRLAAIEDGAVFCGIDEAGIDGLQRSAAHEQRHLPADVSVTPRAIAKALNLLQREEIPGPYVVVLGQTLHDDLISTFDDTGHPILRHLTRLVGEEGRIERASSMDGALVLGLGGHVGTLSIGSDVALSYAGHDDVDVKFRLEESLTFQIHADDAVVAFNPAS